MHHIKISCASNATITTIDIAVVNVIELALAFVV